MKEVTQIFNFLITITMENNNNKNNNHKEALRMMPGLADQIPLLMMLGPMIKILEEVITKTKHLHPFEAEKTEVGKKEILKLTSDIEAILTMFLTKQLLLHKSLKGVQEDLEETFEARDFLDSMKDLKNSENKKSDG